MSVIDEPAAPVEPPAQRGRPPRPPRVPRPPRRPPTAPRGPVVLSPGEALARSVVTTLLLLVMMFVLNVTVFSHLQHLASQQRLEDDLRAQLAAGTAPVSEGTFEDVLLADGAPVAIMDIPRLRFHEVVVEGTSSAQTALGVGHRRDSVLPGQAGVSVLMGRAAAFGGPFSAISSLEPGDEITVRTGQGLQVFEVMGLRYAGDPTPPNLTRGESRLILQTARGVPYIPTGIAYVDARLVSETQPAGARLTTTTLDPSHRAMATDVRTVWALVFAVQFLIAVEIAAVWSFRRFGAQKTWIVFLPVGALAGFFVADQLTRLLPNLL
ncbi:sortase [uncultured Microbacterium sp.]|uniref:sortase domain-containing protein n=1 Tax=uncultured Microbacterium sp. TaxID=191216 RepID=UPI0025D69BF1|nr:sortase [uncultured Microbacterium sp.]